MPKTKVLGRFLLPGNEDATGFVKSLIEKRNANWSVAELDWMMDRNAGIGPLYTGKQISVEGSMQCVAVYACIRILAETIASLPIPVYKRLQPRGKERDRSHPLYPILNEQPNPEMTAFSLRECQMGHLNLWGNAYQEIEYDSGGIDVKALWPLRPDRMAIKRNEQGRLFYEYTLPSGEKKNFGKMQIHHVHGLSSNGIVGISPISYAREAIGMALAAEEYSGRFFGNDSTPGGILTHPGKLKSEGKQNLKESWEAAHSPLSNKHRVAVLEEGVTWTQIGIPPKDAQFLEMRKFQITEIARLFRIPPHMLADLDRATFSNIEHQSLEFVIYTIRPWLERDEQSIHVDLFTPKERETHFAEYLVEGLLRGDIKTRYEAYAVGRNNGWLNADEIRELENMNEMPDGQGKIYLIPMNMIPAGQVTNISKPPPAPTKELSSAEQKSYDRQFIRQMNEILRSDFLKALWSKELPLPEGNSIEPEETRARWSGSAANRRRIAKSYERLFKDATLRLVKREEAEIMRAADKYLERRDSQQMSIYLDDFYRDFPPAVVRAVQPIIGGLAELVAVDALAEIGFDDEPDPELDVFVREYSEIMARDYTESSLGQLKSVLALAIVGALNPVAALQSRFDEWKEKRPEKVAEKESRETANSVTRRKWIRKGVTKLRWVTAGDSCPFCAALNGKIVGIEQVFLAADEEFKPEGAETAFKPSRKVSYPPIHKGCSCGISAA